MDKVIGEINPTIRPFVDSDDRLDGSSRQMDTILLLTLAWLLVYPPDVEWVASALQVVTIAGIVFRSVRHSAWFWGFLTTFLLTGVWVTRMSADNHRYLAGYWCLAVCVALLSTRRVATLASNARYLVAFSFAFAVVWKTLTPDFLDGRFFEAQLLTDSRFSWVAQFIGQLSPHALASNSTVMETLLDPGSSAVNAPITASVGLTVLAFGLTYAVYGIELLIAVAFFARPIGLLGRWRQDLLFMFILVTYAAAPVYSYGWLLAVLGLASSDPQDRIAKYAFFAAIVTVQSYSFLRTTLA